MTYNVQLKNGLIRKVDANTPEEAIGIVAKSLNELRISHGIDPVDESEFGLSVSETPREQRKPTPEEVRANANEYMKEVGTGALGLLFPMTQEAAESGKSIPRQAGTAFLEGATLGLGPVVGKGLQGLRFVPEALQYGFGRSAIEGAANIAALKATEATADTDMPLSSEVAYGAMPIAGEATGRAINWLGPKLKGKASDILQNVFIPKAKKMNSPNPPDFSKGLEEGLFRGFGKYSSLDRIRKKQMEILAPLEELKANGVPVDLDKARDVALANVNSDTRLLEDEKDVIRDQIDRMFGKESARVETIVPAKTHQEKRLTEKYKEAQRLADIEKETLRRSNKAKVTRERNKWFKNPSPDEPFPFYPETPDIKPTGYGKKFENVDVIDEPERAVHEIPLPLALSKKSGAQEMAYERSAQSERGRPRALREFSRGLLGSIAESNPEAREIISQSAPYYSLEDVISSRQNVGGSNPAIGLKDLAAIMSGGVVGGAGGGSLGAATMAGAGLATNKLLTTPKGAQAIYDLGKIMESKRPNLEEAKTKIDFLKGIMDLVPSGAARRIPLQGDGNED